MKYYRYIQVLSLDVVAGACISMLYLAKVFQTIVPSLVVTALGVAVWLIYTADHLLDARKTSNPSTFRHNYHLKHFNILLFIWIIVAIFGVILIFYLPITTIKYGILLLVAVVLYFTSLYIFKSNRMIFKEAAISIIYSAGVFVSPIVLGTTTNLFTWLWLFSIYFLFAFINVLIFALYDEKIDKQDGHNSVVIVFGNQSITKLVNFLWVIGCSILLIYIEDFSAYYIYIVMFLMLGSLIVFRNFFKKNDWYRVVGDGIFMMPIIPLLV